MINLIDHLDAKEALVFNAGLQKKKNALRKALKDKGVLKREGRNNFDKYSYFSEAQYKALFTELLSSCGLELSFTELDYSTYEGSEKQSNGRMVKLAFILTDCETGFYEVTEITAEGMDKGDKAGYKAYTGALKYFLADTFMVATGDDPETESPEAKMNTRNVRTASPKQLEILRAAYVGQNMERLLAANGLKRIEDMPMEKASDLIGKLKSRKTENVAEAESRAYDSAYD